VDEDKETRYRGAAYPCFPWIAIGTVMGRLMRFPGKRRLFASNLLSNIASYALDQTQIVCTAS
jgi:hypothetical protein